MLVQIFMMSCLLKKLLNVKQGLYYTDKGQNCTHSTQFSVYL